jgi:hypothetical protein
VKIALLLFALGASGCGAQIHQDGAASAPVALPPSDPPETASFAAQYPLGVWQYGQPVPGFNISACSPQVCIAALNNGSIMAAVRSERTSAGGVLGFAVTIPKCATMTIDRSYVNLPRHPAKFSQFVASKLREFADSASRSCPGLQTKPLPALNTDPLWETIR